jgi:hypothetical protein
MRYTGTGLTGDQGEKNFLNVVQLQVSLQGIPDSKIRLIKQNLGSEKVRLKPVPIHHLEALLVLPLGSEGRNQKIGSSAGAETSESKVGNWSERTFSIRLENHDAQILWNQIRKGQLAVSISYGIYAELVPGIPDQLSVDRQGSVGNELVSEMETVMQFDSSTVMQILDAGAFPIQIDPLQWPEVIQQIDLNETNSNAWALLEVRCYDFTNQLRPDLGIKAIEFQATDAHGQPVYLRGKNFSSSRPDFNSQQIRFPIAVNLQQPYLYKVTEYESDGTKHTKPWQTISNWNKILDITTPPEKINSQLREIEIEVASNILQDTSFNKYVVTLAYQQNGQPKSVSLEWQKNDPVSKNLSIIADKDTNVLCYLTCLQRQIIISGEPVYLKSDNYIFINEI